MGRMLGSCWVSDLETARRFDHAPGFQVAGRDTGNVWYPLPADYPDLTADGQRSARVAAVSSWQTPEEFVQAWALFRSLYFFQLPTGMFYTTGICPSPTAHYDWVHDYMAYTKNIMAAPRGSAKSIIIGKEIPILLSLTRPFSHIILLLSNNDMVVDRFETFMEQFEQNEFLQHDFGRVHPKRGSAEIWNHSHLKLLNGSVLRGISIDSRKRGPRATDLILDDPEYDPKNEAIETDFRNCLETLVFRQMLPMLEVGCRFFWIGTMLSRRSALWAACMGEDPRFRFWNRRVYSLVHYDGHGRAHYMWESKWDAKAASRMRKEYGAAAFETEFQNNPVSTTDKPLRLHDPYNLYEIVGDQVRWRIPGAHGAAELAEEPYASWRGGLACIMLVDPTHTTKITSDFAAAVVLGVDARRWWWVLDLRLGHWIDTELAAQVYDLGRKWNVAIIGVESVVFQDHIRQALAADIVERQQGDTQVWRPLVYPIKYSSKLSKPSRIANSLSVRLAQYTLRLPAHLRHLWPMNELFLQIENFTLDLALLPHDDALDALALAGYCPMPTPGSSVAWGGLDNSIEAQLRAGRTVDRVTGLPLRLFINPQTINPALIAELDATHHTIAARDAASQRGSSAQSSLRRQGSLFLPDYDTLRQHRPTILKE